MTPRVCVRLRATWRKVVALRTRRSRGPRKFRLHKPRWVDPFPMIPGTEPEKRVFALLVQMRLFFIYQGQVPEFEKGHPMFFLAPPNYKPDFILPEYRLIIDPFSPFHHSQDEAVARDVKKVARYAAAGYSYYHPWAVAPGRWTWNQYRIDLDPPEFRKLSRIGRPRDKYRNDINRGQRFLGTMNTLEMLLSIPELKLGPRYKLTDPRDIAAKQMPGYRIGQYLGAGATSVGAANRSRARPALLGLRVGSRRGVRRSR